MKLNFRLLCGAAAALLIASCQKKDNTPVDLSKVEVAFTTISSGEVYHKGDTLNINANISYPGEFVGIYAEVNDSATGQNYYIDNQDTHTNNFPFQRSWVDTLSESTTLQVKILVYVANNTSVPAERSIYVKSLP